MYFNPFAGREPGVTLRYRFPDHWAELVLKRRQVDEDALLSAHAAAPLAGSEVADRRHSQLVRLDPDPRDGFHS